MQASISAENRDRAVPLFNPSCFFAAEARKQVYPDLDVSLLWVASWLERPAAHLSLDTLSSFTPGFAS